GALTTLIVGMAVVFIRLSLELASDSLNPNSFLYAFGNVNFLTFSSWFFLFSILVCLVVSMTSAAPSAEQIKGLTFSTLSAEQKTENRASYNTWDIVFSLVVLAIVVYIMTSFTG
ncbi:MAG: hypothetical protein RIB86_19815, partial [Imperialibacter sp.]